MYKDDIDRVKTLVVSPTRRYNIVTGAVVKLGQLFKAHSDFFGTVNINVGDEIDGKTVKCMALSNDSRTLQVLLAANDGSYKQHALHIRHNPFPDNETFKELFWSAAGIVKEEVPSRVSNVPTMEQLFAHDDYAVTYLGHTGQLPVEEDTEDSVQALFESDDIDKPTKRFIMKAVGDMDASIRKSVGSAEFPIGISEEWLHNRFLQTSSFLSEVFSFPDEITREVYLASWLVKNGSTLLSGIPGTGKTFLVDTSTLLFMNSYGYTDYQYVPKVTDRIRHVTPNVIYKNLNAADESKNPIRTTPPTREEIIDPANDWVVIRNIDTTDKTRIDKLESPVLSGISKDTDMDRLGEIYDEEGQPEPMPLLPEDMELIREQVLFLSEFDNEDNFPEYIKQAIVQGNARIHIGKYVGPTLTQRYSRNRTGEAAARWQDERFDADLIRPGVVDYGIMLDRYYRRTLMKMTPTADGGNRYGSDLIYDMARYPDTGIRVEWEKEIRQELAWRELVSRKFSIDYDGGKEEETVTYEQMIKAYEGTTSPERQNSIEAHLKSLESAKSNIRKKAELGTNFGISEKDRNEQEAAWKEVYTRGTAGTVSFSFLENMNKRYKQLLADMISFIDSGQDIDRLSNARSYDDIVSEMKMDMGLTTCSENKTPEEILYTTEISLVHDRDDMGRVTEEYVFRPSPLGFVTKPGKFLNEFTRADKDFQDQLLSLLDRRLVEYRGENFISPEFILFCDNNPHKLLSSDIDWALFDRIDVEIFLKGATIGTKDMVLSRKFGGSGSLKADHELLNRIQLAIRTLNPESMDDLFDATEKFANEGIIPKKSDQEQGIIPIRFRELQAMWGYVGQVSIPRNVLHYTYLLTSTLNQAWYMMKDKFDGAARNFTLGKEKTKMIPKNYKVYGSEMKPNDPDATLQPRDLVMDYSMLSFADDFTESSAVISNRGTQGENQFPLGVYRPVGIRFVESLLRFAKALAWLRRGPTEVTIDEINDLFPMVGSHRLNIMPFGDKHVAGVHDIIKSVFPNIQDFLKHGILDTYWKGDGTAYQSYLSYYQTLEAIVGGGDYNVDDNKPSVIITKVTDVPDISNLAGKQENEDVLTLDIMNGVEHAKRNSPEYKRHYLYRIGQVQNMAKKNYYEEAVKSALKHIQEQDTARPGQPDRLFKKDVTNIRNRLVGPQSNGGLMRIFVDDYRKTPIADVSVVRNVVIPTLDAIIAFTHPETHEIAVDDLDAVKRTRERFDALNKLDMLQDEINKMDWNNVDRKSDKVDRLGNSLTFAEYILMRLKDVDDTIDLTAEQISGADVYDGAALGMTGLLTKDNVLSIIDMTIKNCAIPALNVAINQFDYGDLDVVGSFVIEYDANRYMNWKATTLNEHLLWLHFRFGDDFKRRPNLEEQDMI